MYNENKPKSTTKVTAEIPEKLKYNGANKAILSARKLDAFHNLLCLQVMSN